MFTYEGYSKINPRLADKIKYEKYFLYIKVEYTSILHLHLIVSHKRAPIILLHQLLQALDEECCYQGTQPRVDVINEILIGLKAMGSQPGHNLGDTWHPSPDLVNQSTVVLVHPQCTGLDSATITEHARLPDILVCKFS